MRRAGVKSAQLPHTFFLLRARSPLREEGSLKPSERASRQVVRNWFSNSEALKGGYVKDLRPRVDPVGIPPRKERAPVRHHSLPVRATELNQLSHPSALRGRSDPRAGALVALNPNSTQRPARPRHIRCTSYRESKSAGIRTVVLPAGAHLGTQSQAGKKRKDAFASITSGPLAAITRKETLEGAMRAGSGFTPSLKTVRIGGCIPLAKAVAGSDVGPKPTHVNSRTCLARLRMAGSAYYSSTMEVLLRTWRSVCLKRCPRPGWRDKAERRLWVSVLPYK